MNTVIEIVRSDNSREIINDEIKITYLNQKNKKIAEFLKYTENNGFKVKKLDIPSREERNAR